MEDQEHSQTLLFLQHTHKEVFMKMGNKKRFKKIVEWKIKNPEWTAFFMALSILFYAHLILTVFNPTKFGAVSRLIMATIFIFFEYLCFGKYPYKRQVFYDQVK